MTAVLQAMTGGSVAALVLSLTSLAALAQAPDAVQARMQAWSKALGVGCAHCHVEGDYKAAVLPAFDMAFRMNRMVGAVNQNDIIKAAGGVTCATCHRGTAKPQELAPDAWQAIAQKYDEAFDGDGNLRISMSYYSAALGVECTHCHVAGNYGSDDNPVKGIARRMRGIAGSLPKHFAGGPKQPGIQCFACHQGKPKP
jgi:mono/diheme cytochrome c family protein